MPLPALRLGGRKGSLQQRLARIHALGDDFQILRDLRFFSMSGPKNGILAGFAVQVLAGISLGECHSSPAPNRLGRKPVSSRIFRRCLAVTRGDVLSSWCGILALWYRTIFALADMIRLEISPSLGILRGFVLTQFRQAAFTSLRG